MLDQYNFISLHSWPSEKDIVRYIVNENNQYKHNFPLSDHALFYKHDLAKELWTIVMIKDFPKKRKEYRHIGYVIYLHGKKNLQTDIDSDLVWFSYQKGKSSFDNRT